MIELRRSPRYTALARARVEGSVEEEGLLRDLSVTGCRLEFSAAIALPREGRFNILVLPETASTVEPFKLEAVALWSRAAYDSFEVGFSIDASPKGRAFQRYVDYLAWRSAAAAAAAGAGPTPS